jgi:citrate synthase
MLIEDKIAAQLPAWRERVQRLVKSYGSVKVGEVTVEQIYSGIRGVQVNVSDVSYVDPQVGIRIRGYMVPELLEELPKAPGSRYPLAGGIYYLLMVDQMPTLEQALQVEDELRRRSRVPIYVYELIRAMPACAHPMTMFSQAILALNCDGIFNDRYNTGMPKTEYWKATLEDSMNLVAKIPSIAGFIYNLRFKEGRPAHSDHSLDWSANVANMIIPGSRDYHDLMRLFVVLHSDHEGSNVSAHTAQLVNSALSDVYYSSSAAMCGLAGPLHGLANQECLRWLLGVHERFGGLPSKEALADFARDWLKSGQVIPGYGHPVLRVTDPRFTAQLNFGNEHFPDAPLFSLAKRVYEVVPDVLMETGKVKNPWPNVDALSGSIQHHFGVCEDDFYTVLFGVSRIMGLTAQMVWDRALGKPIERPKSLTTRMLEELVGI